MARGWPTSLSLGGLSPEQLLGFGDGLFTALRYGAAFLPNSFAPQASSSNADQDLLTLMSERLPLAVFDLYFERVLLAAKGKPPIYNAPPTDLEPLTELPKTKNYLKLVRGLCKG